LGCLVILGLASCKPTPAPVVPVKITVPGATQPVTGTTPGVIPGATLSPSATSVPLAAKVNGLEISLAEYQSELVMYQAAKGTELAPEDKQRVLDDLIDGALLAQAAQEKGFTVDEAMLQERIKRITSDLGGDQALQTWLTTYSYDGQSFHRALARSIQAAWMRDQIASAVSPTAEQVHARQILLYTAAQADEIYQQLKAGNDFGNLAIKYDPLTGGDLGWFPRNTYPPEIEDVAFKLPLNKLSDVVKDSFGSYHILQVLGKDDNRALSKDQQHALGSAAFGRWLAEQRLAAKIDRYIDFKD
jgi:peptidyl-prolyl cis-trans isomerase C